MKAHIVILSADTVFARMLELEFGMYRLRVRVLADAEEPFDADVVLLDLDSAVAPINTSYRHMIGFTRASGLAPDDARQQCAMIFHRPFEMRLLRREVLAQIGMSEGSVVSPKEPTLKRAVNETAEIRLEGERLYCGAQSVLLSPKEIQVVTCLLAHRGEAVSRQTISDVIGESSANKVDVYVCYLRRKLMRECGIRLIDTVRGEGYRIV